MPGLFSQHLLLCPLTVAVCSRWMPGVYENKHQDSFLNIYCYFPWQSQFVLDGCLAFIKKNAWTLSQRLLLCPLTVAVCYRWMPGILKKNARILSQHLLLCPLTVAVCSRWMPGIYENKDQDSFPNVYCYVSWQSQFVLDGCLAFIFINARTLFPMSTAMFLYSRSLFSMDACHLFSEMPGLFSQHLLLCPLIVAVCSRLRNSVYENKHKDSFLNVYCYVPWQSQFVLDWCLPFIFINARTLFPTSTGISFDSRSLLSMDAWRLWK